MSDEDDFEPRLGRMRSSRAKGARKYLGRILAAAMVAGRLSAGARRRFDGSRVGRGSARGRFLHSRLAAREFANRRVIVKTRLVRLAGKGGGAAAAHLRYIQRDGVTRDGAPGELYSAALDRVDGREFLERAGGDRHQFRFIVSAEEGDLYGELKPFVRRLMEAAEKDLGTKLDWVAVDHFNTAHPHSHVIVRGVDDRGRNLVIAREYISHGFRMRASEIASEDLGPVTRLEIETRLQRDIRVERLTDIDRQLLSEAEKSPLVSATLGDPFEQSLRAGRLQKLGRLGLADEMAPGQWRLAGGLEETLRRMGERGDIIKTMNRALAERAVLPVDQVVHERSAPLAEPIVGRVVARGLADEIADRHYLVVEAIDGRVHYVDIGAGEATEALPHHAIVRVAPARSGARDVDRTIAAVAKANGGVYSGEAHRLRDSEASADFIDAHGRRLEAMRRAGQVDRLASGSWAIAADHVERAAAFEKRSAAHRPVAVEILSPVPIESLPRADGVTWLDRQALDGGMGAVRNKGFGEEVRRAAAARQQWLLREGLAENFDGDLRYKSGTVALLQRRELLRLARQLSSELGKPFAETQTGDVVEGKIGRPLDAAGGRYAIVEKSHEFTLVPWRPVLARHVGKEVGGIMRDGGVSWRIGRGRTGPEMT